MMATYEVALPDGRTMELEGPEGASDEEIVAQAKRLMATQQTAPQEAPTEAAALPAPAPEVPPIDYNQVAADTANDLTGYEKFAAGMGGAVAGLGIGGRQILANMLGNEDWQKQLQEEALEHKRLTGALNDTGAGMAGNVVGNIAMAALPGGIAGRAAGGLTAYGVPALAATAATEGAIGAGMGAALPTTEEGERMSNVLTGGALGAAGGVAVPLAGKAVRGIIGKTDPAVERAAGILQRYGIDVPKADQAPGLLSQASSAALESTPGVNLLMAGKQAAREDQVRTALFKLLGKEVPESGEELGRMVDEIGSQIGAASAGKSAPMYGAAKGIQGVLDDYKILDAQRHRPLMRTAEEIIDKTSTPGYKMSGEEYQAIRSQLQADARTATGQHKRALSGMAKVLDDEFEKVLTTEEAVKLAGDKEKLRLAKIIERTGLKDGQLDLRAAQRAVEREAKRGSVMKEGRELLEAYTTAVPKSRPGGRLGSSVFGAGLTLTNLPLAAALAGGAGATRAILNTGAPQKVVNSATIRRMTADAIRGLRQSANEEDE